MRGSPGDIGFLADYETMIARFATAPTKSSTSAFATYPKEMLAQDDGANRERRGGDNCPSPNSALSRSHPVKPRRQRETTPR